MTFDSREQSQHDGQPVECFRFVKGSDAWLLTSADRAIDLPTGTYTPAQITRGESDQSQEDEAGALEVTLPRSHAIAQLFVAFLPTTVLTLTVFRAHRGDESLAVIRWVGTVASVRFDGPQATLTCLPVDGAFRRAVPGLRYQGQCNWALYGDGCGVDRNAFKFSGTISLPPTLGGTAISITGLNAQPDGWYTNGWIEAPDGEVRFIVAHTGNELRIMNPFAGDVGSGTPVEVFPGCDRSEATCVSKFNNLVNHLGFPRIPTHNPHVGGVV